MVSSWLRHAVAAGVKLTLSAPRKAILHKAVGDVRPAQVADKVVANVRVGVPILLRHKVAIVAADALDAQVKVASLGTRVVAASRSNRKLLLAAVAFEGVA